MSSSQAKNDNSDPEKEFLQMVTLFNVTSLEAIKTDTKERLEIGADMLIFCDQHVAELMTIHKEHQKCTSNLTDEITSIQNHYLNELASKVLSNGFDENWHAQQMALLKRQLEETNAESDKYENEYFSLTEESTNLENKVKGIEAKIVQEKKRIRKERAAEEMKRIEEEAERKRQEQAEWKRKEEEEAERKRQEQAEWERMEKEAECKRQEQAEWKRKEKEAERKRLEEKEAERKRYEEEEAQQKHKEEEIKRKRKEEAERKRQMEEEAERKREEGAERKRRKEEEAERKRMEKEAERKRKEKEAERKRKEKEAERERQKESRKRRRPDSDEKEKRVEKEQKSVADSSKRGRQQPPVIDPNQTPNKKESNTPGRSIPKTPYKKMAVADSPICPPSSGSRAGTPGRESPIGRQPPLPDRNVVKATPSPMMPPPSVRFVNTTPKTGHQNAAAVKKPIPMDLNKTMETDQDDDSFWSDDD